MISLLLFGWLAKEVLAGATLQFDSLVRNAIHSWASPQLTYAMRGITLLGSPAFLLMVTVVLVWRLSTAGRPRAAMLLVIAGVGALALDEILKLIFRRHRPEAFFGLLDPASYSFPSGHAITSCCFYGVLAAILTVRMKSHFTRLAVWTVAALLIAAIGFSRIYLGVHYPSDVVAGYSAAIVWVAAVRASYGLWLRRASRRSLASSSDRREASPG